MRNLNGFKWLCALALIGTAANADVIIDNQTIPGSDIQSIIISPTSGNIFISTTPGYTVTKNASTPGGVVVNLTASSLSIATGQSVTLNWSTTNATNCSATGGSGGWAGSTIGLPFGSKAVTPTAAGTYTFTLSCNNSTTNALDSVSVTVSDPSEPPPTNCTAPSLSNTAVPQQWDSFWGVAFPQPTIAIKRLNIGRSGYNYISFNTGDANGNGAVLLIETTTSPGVRLGSISACPGDFEVANVCKGKWGLNAWIAYSTNGVAGTCQLSKNATYYLNFTFTDGKDASTSTCSSSRCLVEIQVGFRAQ